MRGKVTSLGTTSRFTGTIILVSIGEPMTRPIKSHGLTTEIDPRAHRLRYRVKPKGAAANQADRIKLGHKLLREAVHANPGRFVPAAQVLLDFFARETNQTKIQPNEEDRAFGMFERFLSHLLWAKEYDKVAGLLWAPTLFTAEPYSVSEVWAHVGKHQQAFIVGPGGVGKSYSIAAWLLVDWLADPEWTHVKLLSVTKAHAEKNIFAHVKNLHQASSFPLPGEVLANSIRVGSRQNSGFQLTTIPQGDSGAGRLRGCHPDPRPKEHPRFGTHSRIRIALDEAELIGDGAYVDIGNLLLTEGADSDHMKIIAATNPKDQSTPFGRCCEPPFGWKDVSAEGSHCWQGQNGVQVLRIDGAKTENVKQKKLIYPGFMTYDGYQRYADRGSNDSEYWCVDTETQVLSKRGWLDYFTLLEGDEIYTLNTETGKAEWATADQIYVGNYNGKMISMEGQNMSALVTPNHKWPTTHKQRIKAGVKKLTLKETTDLKQSDLIPLIRDQGKCSASKYDGDFAEILGWVLSDGHLRKQGTVVQIGQSHSANKEKCGIIRSLLNKVGANFWEHFKDLGYGQMIVFNINGPVASEIRKAIPRKKLTVLLIESLGIPERNRLLDGLIGGDGGICGGSTPYIVTKDAEQAGMYAALIAMTGHSNKIHTRIVPEGKPLKNGRTIGAKVMHQVHKLECKYTRGQYIKQIPVDYNGIVWCPSSRNKTFYARRNGIAYFTGNTMARGFWPPSGTVGGLILPADRWDKAEVMADFIFTGTPIEIGAVDTALEGGDDCIFGHGRFGFAWGIQMPDGRKIKFPKHIPCLQAIQATVLPKGDAVNMGKAIKAAAEGCNISPENLILDITGNGSGPYAWLRHYWTPGEVTDIKGVDSGTSASDMPLFQEDSEIASERFKGMHSELCFCSAAWVEYGYLKFRRGFPIAEVRREATNRQYLTQGKLRVVEKKETFKARMRCNSPDRWDMVGLMVHRARSIDMGTMQISMTRPEEAKAEPSRDWFHREGTDQSDPGVEFVDLT